MSLDYIILMKRLSTILCLFIVVICKQEITVEQSWIYASLTGVGLSLLGFAAAILLVSVQSCLDQDSFSFIINLLYSLGCGALIGDAVIHILPEAYKDQSAKTTITSLVFICAIMFFLLIERGFEACGITHTHWGEQHQHQLCHHQNQQNPESIQVKNHENEQNIKRQQNQAGQTNLSKIQQENNFIQNLKGKKPAGYLNLMSSFIHNFFDGFAIGVAFATRDSCVYMPVVVAIFCHQIPRQMGDVGILMKSGFSNYQTIFCNGFINFTSLIGLFPGLAMSSISDSSKNYLMTFVAGNFIYIGADIWRNLLRNKSCCQNLSQMIVFSIGVGAMFLVLLVEGSQ